MFVVVIGLEFLFGFELGEIVEGFASDHGFIWVEFKLVIGGDGIKELLYFIDAEFFDFVAVEEERQFDKMIPEMSKKLTGWRRFLCRRIHHVGGFRR